MEKSPVLTVKFCCIETSTYYGRGHVSLCRYSQSLQGKSGGMRSSTEEETKCLFYSKIVLKFMYDQYISVKGDNFNRTALK